MSAPRLLFLPGAGADPGFWRPLGDRLPGAWPKHYFAWPGLGDQPHDPAVTGFDDLVAMVEARLDEGPAVLVAQSMGGLVALTVASRDPGRVRGLVLAATSGGVAASEPLMADWRADYARDFPRAAPWIRALRLDLTEQLPRVACRALLLWGDADPISPVAAGQRLCAILPEARLHVVAGGAHDLARTHAGSLAPLVAAEVARWWGPTPSGQGAA